MNVAGKLTGRTGALLAGLSALALSGCQSTSAQKEGPRTTLQASDSRIRSQLTIRPELLVGAFYRQAPTCTYTHVRTVAGSPPVTGQAAVAVKPVRDRLLITLTDGSKSSTALIGADGTMHDFNLVDDEGRRWTSETYAAQARRAAPNGEPVINQFTAMFPRYVKGPWTPGTGVGDVRTQDGILWAEYIYRGRTSFRGREAAVIDMVTVTAKKSSRHLVGFNIIDAVSLMPLLYVFQAQNKIRVEQTSCP